MVRVAVVVMVMVMLASGCTGGGDIAAPTETPVEEPSTEEASPSPSPRPSPSRSARPSPSPTPRLDARYYQDSDGNVVPDFLEVELGYDPLVDDCALATGCPGIDQLTGSPITAEQNVLLILDSSGSMAGADPSGAVKIDAAKAALERYVVGTPDNFNLGLMVYGHRGNNQESGKAESCAGIEVFNQLDTLTVDTVAPTLAQFNPTGWTPIAASLTAAAQAFTGREGQANRVVLVTDGIETCDGDPVAAATALKQAGIAVTVDVVGFDVPNSAEQAALRAIAEATGGTYTNATQASQLDDYFQSLLGVQADLITARTCVLSNVSSARACTITLAGAARRELIRLRDEDAEPQGPMRDLLDRLEDWEADNIQILEANTAPVVEDLLRQLEAAQARYRERYGEDIAGAVTCPDLIALRAGGQTQAL